MSYNVGKDVVFMFSSEPGRDPRIKKKKIWTQISANVASGDV